MFCDVRQWHCIDVMIWLCTYRAVTLNKSTFDRNSAVAMMTRSLTVEKRTRGHRTQMVSSLVRFMNFRHKVVILCRYVIDFCAFYVPVLNLCVHLTEYVERNPH